MIYVAQLAIPAQTTKAAPYKQTLSMGSGWLTHMWVRWYYGSANLCGLRASYHSFTHWPWSGAQWFVSSPYPFEFEDNFHLHTEPYELLLEGYNEDDVYPHTVWVAVSVIRPKELTGVTDFLTWLSQTAEA